MIDATKRRNETAGDAFGIFDLEFLWYLATAATVHPGASTSRAQLAGRLSLLLSPDDFQRFLPELMRELMEEEAWRTVGDFLAGLIEASRPREVPVPDALIRDLLECPDERVQEAAAELRKHREMHVELRIVR